MLWPDAIRLAGTPVPLDDVRADVQIHHGRQDVADDPVASTCQVVLAGVSPEFVASFRVGVLLEVSVRDGAAAPAPRFTGTVTDARLDVDELTIIATGRLARLRSYVIGLNPWPVEPWSDRLRRLFAEAGVSDLLDLRPDPSFDPPLAARDPVTAGPTTLGDYLAFLAPMVGAAIADGLDGSILVQAIGSRSIDNARQLDPADVLYAPAWVMALPGGNIVTVRYTGDQSQSVTLRDEASIGLYGERPSTLDTTFVDAADATTRARSRLDRLAYAQWAMLEAPIVRGLELELGAPVLLSSMPASSPYDPWTPIVEGWSETIAGDVWTMQLALSDPRLSGITPLAWIDVPAAGYPWNTVPATTAWYEAQSLESITPARS